MSQRINLWLIRHGQTITPKQKSYIGQTQLQLSSLGKQQMLNYKDFFSQQSLAVILSSDLLRCQESAELMCPMGTSIIYDARFREINLGTWDGCSIAEIKKEHPEAYAKRGANMDSFCPPQGESFQDVSKRVFAALKYYSKQYATKNVALITHAGVNRVILANYLSIPLRSLLDIPQPYACCTQIAFP